MWSDLFNNKVLTLGPQSSATRMEDPEAQYPYGKEPDDDPQEHRNDEQPLVAMR
ncbi:hypothetical protein H1R20_g16430, partial [Candolleomyces eurysporus]